MKPLEFLGADYISDRDVVPKMIVRYIDNIGGPDSLSFDYEGIQYKVDRVEYSNFDQLEIWGKGKDGYVIYDQLYAKREAILSYVCLGAGN